MALKGKQSPPECLTDIPSVSYGVIWISRLTVRLETSKMCVRT